MLERQNLQREVGCTMDVYVAIDSNEMGVKVQVYTKSNIMINIQDRLHKGCCYGNCYSNFIGAIFVLNYHLNKLLN